MSDKDFSNEALNLVTTQMTTSVKMFVIFYLPFWANNTLTADSAMLHYTWIAWYFWPAWNAPVIVPSDGTSWVIPSLKLNEAQSARGELE